jgi:hypothetical protein
VEAVKQHSALELASRELQLLSTRAYKGKLDAFTRVKKVIDDMITDLMEEKDREKQN